MAITGMRTFLWFDSQALEAAQLYESLLPDVRIENVSYGPEGNPFVVEFEMFGNKFAGLNAGPHFTHSPAVSFMIHADTQEELDRVWFGLIEGGGSESQCGWCVDRFGLSWQVLPSGLQMLLGHADPEVSGKAWAAMMTMSRIDMAALEQATGVALS